jgi:uncharacterized membrane protein YqjE
MMTATYLAYLECIKGPGLPPYCPSFHLYFAALGFLDFAVLVLLLRPGHYRLLLASAFDVFLCAVGTFIVVGGVWRISSQVYIIAIWLLSIAHAAMLLVPVVREYYRKRTDLILVDQK